MRRVIVYLAALLVIIGGSILIARPSSAQSTIDPTLWFTPVDVGEVDEELYCLPFYRVGKPGIDKSKMFHIMELKS